ncbi:uncharacterized protein (TIGR00369 family) [Streptomyces griseochromogenes]|uniref:Phenylacetic acid degradation protein n=1 Tax=Streptomyces griseochromogenes TaxID=68214 RepID=A0A1B1BEJ0_9ACTN|nr:PaaI family thioesterase [Streptomyces griseochromogenes]ANP57189.1 phenylacetic acid degradation protein [Streptomyces griseochromogenes]MBP2054849.1 uncharacterized protein (TIGR00369 family) [Streptomyces griseochromogenes]
MNGRCPSFWDALQGRVPLPRAAVALGTELLETDVENGTVQVAFTASEECTNPTGNVLGAFLSAMLYDTVGPALLATLGPDQFQSTMELNASFLRPVRPGRILGRGRVVHRVGDIAFLEASLSDADDVVVATASATARVIPLDGAETAA